jgi:acyl-homoserine lactone acylase PvdQ
MKKWIFILFLPLQLMAQKFSKEEIQRWEKQAKAVTIVRDNWGIPHIYGKKDADCVFGLLYAQCEDDFRRVENNYIEMLGRTAEIKGGENLYNDLLVKLVIDSASAVEDYKKSPLWLKELLHAFADGVNYYLYKNPGVKPALLQSFQPWYPLMYTDGSISAISTAGITVNELKNFYSNTPNPIAVTEKPYADEVQIGSMVLRWHHHVLHQAMPYCILIHMLLFISGPKCI